MSFNIVLVHPAIPQNTGNIGRLAAATDTILHLVEPLGFELSDRYLKRAGLDYWPEIRLVVHKSWDRFLLDSGCASDRIWLFSTHAEKPFHRVPFADADFLVFGCETKGLPPEIHEAFPDRRLLIPMANPRIRSLNL